MIIREGKKARIDFVDNIYFLDRLEKEKSGSICGINIAQFKTEIKAIEAYNKIEVNEKGFYKMQLAPNETIEQNKSKNILKFK